MHEDLKSNQIIPFQRHPATDFFIELLTAHAASPNADRLLSYEELETACGLDCRAGGEGYGKLSAAMKHLEKDRQIYYRRLPGKGIKPASVVETLEDARTRVQGAHRHTGKTMRILRCIDLPRASAEERLNAYVIGAMTAVAHVGTSGKAEKRLEPIIKAQQDRLTMEQTIVALKGVD